MTIPCRLKFIKNPDNLPKFNSLVTNQVMPDIDMSGKNNSLSETTESILQKLSDIWRDLRLIGQERHVTEIWLTRLFSSASISNTSIEQTVKYFFLPEKIVVNFQIALLSRAKKSIPSDIFGSISEYLIPKLDFMTNLTRVEKNMIWISGDKKHEDEIRSMAYYDIIMTNLIRGIWYWNLIS